MQNLLVKILLKVGSDLLINFLKSGVDELQKRNDNNFQAAADMKKHLDGVKTNGPT